MSDISQQTQLFPVKPELESHALVNAEQYRAMFERAKRDPDGFWAEQAKRLE
jgi:acetyl-CoA synthetase